MRPWYRIPCEIEDISLAFDYQQGEIRMKSKVGSIVVKNSFIRYFLWLIDYSNILQRLLKQLSIMNYGLLPCIACCRNHDWFVARFLV